MAFDTMGYRSAHATVCDQFASGAQAAAHGLAEIEDPSPQAKAAIAKIERARGRRPAARPDAPEASLEPGTPGGPPQTPKAEDQLSR
jgi:hypothetical protein